MSLKLHIAQHVPGGGAVAEQVDCRGVIVSAVSTGVGEPADAAGSVCQGREHLESKGSEARLGIAKVRIAQQDLPERNTRLDRSCSRRFETFEITRSNASVVQHRIVIEAEGFGFGGVEIELEVAFVVRRGWTNVGRADGEEVGVSD